MKRLLPFTIGLLVVAVVVSAACGVSAEDAAISPEVNQALRLLMANDVFSKQAGLLKLEALRDPSTMSAVRPFLDDSNPLLRAQALTAARAIQGKSAIPLLVDRLARDRHADVRRQAANELHELADPSTVPPLVSALEDRQVVVRVAAVEALGVMHDRSVTPAIIRQLRSRDAELRRSCADALGGLRDPQAREALIRRTRDRDVNVRRAAVKALHQLKDPATVPAFIRTLRDRDDTVRKFAMKALGELVTNDTLPPLTKLINAGRPTLRLYAIALLAHLGTPEALAVLQARRARELNDVLREQLDISIRYLEHPATASAAWPSAAKSTP